MRLILATAFSCVFLLSGCAGFRDRKHDEVDDAAIVQSEPAALTWPAGEGPEAEAGRDLEQAASLEAASRYDEALLAYKRAHTHPPLALTASLVVSRCLLALDRPAPALAALEPITIPPVDDIGRKKLALAGQALLMQKNFRAAEKALSWAQDGIDERVADALWAAAAAANLATSLLENDKIEEAYDAYGRASRLYASLGQREKAATCSRMRREIDELLYERRRFGY